MNESANSDGACVFAPHRFYIIRQKVNKHLKEMTPAEVSYVLLMHSIGSTWKTLENRSVDMQILSHNTHFDVIYCT